jgi:hypothetical protein
VSIGNRWPLFDRFRWLDDAADGLDPFHHQQRARLSLTLPPPPSSSSSFSTITILCCTGICISTLLYWVPLTNATLNHPTSSLLYYLLLLLLLYGRRRAICWLVLDIVVVAVIQLGR